MAGWAERKQRALARVHRTFERPAVYLTHAAGTPIPVNVRIHRKQIVDSLPQVDDWSNGAEAMTLADRIIFDRNEVGNVLPNSYVIYRPPSRPVEGYITGPTKPEREGYVWVEVTPISQDDLDALVEQLDTSDPVWRGTLI